MSLIYKGQTIANVGGSGGVGSSSGGSSEEIYSTEETRIGTWIDGKPLYRKCFCIPASELNGLTTTSKYYDVPIDEMDGILDAERVTNCSGVYYKLNNRLSNVFMMNVLYPSAYNVFVLVADFRPFQHTLRLGLTGTTSSGTRDYTEAIVWIEYTKTTD